MFNGEIFNCIKLRRNLEAVERRFYTQSDTEVIVHLYEDYGEAFVKHLNVADRYLTAADEDSCLLFDSLPVDGQRGDSLSSDFRRGCHDVRLAVEVRTDACF